MLAKTSRLVLACATLFWAFHSTAQNSKYIRPMRCYVMTSHRQSSYYSNYNEPMQDTKGSSAINFDFGGNTFLGDLGGSIGTGRHFVKDFNSKTVRPYFGINYIYFPSNWLGLKAGIHRTVVTGADSLIKKREGHSEGRFERNLSFQSAITEGSAEFELYPLQTFWEYEEARCRLFIGSGIGFFHFNPKAQLNGKWYSLNPLHLEGQGFPEYPERKNYKLTQPYIPLTVGLKYRLSNSYFISLSGCFRKTFTDYIDDVSTTYIDPNLFDKYLSPANAALAKQLYYRASKNSVTYSPTQYRGYAGKDSYTSFFFTITYLFNRRDD